MHYQTISVLFCFSNTTVHYFTALHSALSDLHGGLSDHQPTHCIVCNPGNEASDDMSSVTSDREEDGIIGKHGNGYPGNPSHVIEKNSLALVTMDTENADNKITDL